MRYRTLGKIARDLGVSVDDVAEIALRFSLSDPAVATVVAGMRSITNVERNARAVDRGPLTDEELEALRPHRWVRSFYGDRRAGSGRATQFAAVRTAHDCDPVLARLGVE